MPRAKNKVASRARRKKVLKKAKGNFGRRKNVFTVAVNTVEKGYNHAYIGRKIKKRDFPRPFGSSVSTPPSASTACRTASS